VCVSVLTAIHLASWDGRLLGTPNEQVWPGVGKLPNWHEYPQWKPTKLSALVPGLDADGYDLLEVSTHSLSSESRSGGG
jgi:hypothetical protein